MDQSRSMELDSVVERRQLRTIPSVDSAMIATPSQSSEHLPEPEAVEQKQQDSMQGVEIKSPVRPRTRLERLTEKHTPQRPNWAMADTDTPSVSHSDATARPVKQLRRIPNTIFHPPPVDPSFPLLEQGENNPAGVDREMRTARTDSAHTVARPNWALADAPTPPHRTPQVLTRDVKWPGISPKDIPTLGHGNVHPSRIGQISDRHRPTVAPSLAIRGPVDSGWGQRRRYGITKPTSVPMNARPETSTQLGLIVDMKYSMKDDSMQWSGRVPGDLRKMASSPDNYPQRTAFINHDISQQYVKTEHSHEQQAIDGQALSAEMQLNQNLGSISLRHQNEAIFDREISESPGDYHAAPGLQGQSAEKWEFPPNGVRSMHSAPDLLQRTNLIPNPDLASAFLQVLHPRPTPTTEYLGVFPATSHPPLTQDYGEVSHAPTGSRVLRRVPRFPVANAVGEQHRPVYDRVPGTKPAHTMVGHALATELFALQMQMAEDTESAASSPGSSVFHYDGVDSMK